MNQEDSPGSKQHQSPGMPLPYRLGPPVAVNLTDSPIHVVNWHGMQTRNAVPQPTLGAGALRPAAQAPDSLRAVLPLRLSY